MSLSTGCVLDVDASAIESLVSRDRNHHTLTPTDTTTVRGKAGKGTLFNGTTSFVDCGNDSSLDITDLLTIEAWVKIIQDVRMTYISKDTHDYESAIGESGRGMFFWYGNGTLYSAFEISYGSNNPRDGNWHHIVWVVSKANGIGECFYDGNSLGTDSNTAYEGSSPNNVNIGRRIPAAQYFNGTISSARIYNYALSPTQIKRHYLEKAYLYVPHPVRIP